MATLSNNDIIINYKLGDTSALNQLIGKFDAISKEEQALIEKSKGLNQQLQKLGNEGQQAGNKLEGGMKNAKGEADKMVNSFKSVGSALGIAFSIAGVVAFANKVKDVTLQFDQFRKVIDFTSGSIQQGNFNLRAITEIANKLGISLESAVTGFKTISGAASQAGITSAQTRAIFENVSKAVSAFGLSSEDAKGVFLALGQIISKGTVSAEELRGQIGERIPGAFSIAAKSIGVSEQELNKMMSTGKLLSKDFVVPFTEALGKMSEAAAGKEGAAKTLTRLSNSFDSLMVTMGKNVEEGGIFFNFVRGLTIVTNKMKDLISTQKEVEEQKAFEVQKKVMEEYGRASDEALQKITNNIGQSIRATEQAFIEFRNKRSTAMRQTGKEEDSETKKANDATVARYENELNYLKAVFAGINVIRTERKKNNEVNKETQGLTEAQLKALKEEFTERQKILELEKQFRTLQGELAGDPIARFAAERQFLEKLTKLKEEFAAKGMEISRLEITNTGLEAQKAREEQIRQEAQMQLQTLDGLKAFNEQRKAEMDKRAKEDEQRRLDQMNKTKAENELELQRAKDLEQKKADARQELQQQVYDFIVTNTNAIFELQSQYAAAEMAAKNRQFDEEIRLADGNVQKITEIEEKRRQAEKEYREKEFRANQMQAIANAIFTAAPYIIKYTSGLPVTAGNLALTLGALAAQTGFILAQPMPEFAKGVENFEGGPAIVGEQGRELVRTDKGLFLTPDRATMTYLPKGSDVITAPKTRELLQGNSTFLNRQNQWTAIDTAPIAAAIKSIPVQSLEISERGLERYVTKGNRTTKILNKKRGANL